MSTTKQTRCPHCSSVFNITDEQLAARGGHVRCGGCLQVFRADQHLLAEGAVVAPPPPPPPNPASVPVVARTQSAQPSAAAPAAKRKTSDDESWAFNLLGDELTDDMAEIEAPAAVADTPPPPAAKAAASNSPDPGKKPMFDDEISDLLHEAWSEPSDKDHLKGIGEVDKIKANADESWAQALMSELEEEEKKEQSKNYSMELQPQKAKEPPRKPATAPAPTPPADHTAAKNSPAAKPAAKADNANSKDDDLLSFLNSNSAPVINQRHANLPVEIRTSHMVSINWSYWLTWSFLCTGALVLLLAQFVYFNFEQLALSERTRPQIMQMCTLIGCKAPEPPNIELIAINKLVVRAHPAIKEALRVNAIVYNKANFAQPLPALKLSLLDKRNKVIASRAFQPKEYLQGDAGNLRRIPPQTPIHIQMDIVKPKDDLAAYKMQPLY